MANTTSSEPVENGEPIIVSPSSLGGPPTAEDGFVVDEFAPRRHAARQPIPMRVRLRRQTAIIARWLHIYLSMVAFAIILFFSVTGFTLNHADRFSQHEQVVRASGELPHEWLRPAGKDAAKLEIVERLRSAHKILGAVTDFRVDDQQIEVSFKGPGYTSDAFIDRDTNRYDLTETRSGMLAVMNDLHRGASTGTVWSWVIDACAILLTFVSLTGLTLLFFVYKRRTAGLILAATGALLCWLIYLNFVP
jgi:uncharacterized protein